MGISQMFVTSTESGVYCFHIEKFPGFVSIIKGNLLQHLRKEKMLQWKVKNRKLWKK